MLLSGSDLAGFIKARQAKQVRQLRGRQVRPKLAIVLSNQELASAKYVAAKQRYGSDIGVAVDVYHTQADELEEIIHRLNDATDTHGIIVQLPLPSKIKVERILNLVAPDKDVDGLAKNSRFVPPTPTAILWLLAGYNVELKDRKIAVVGRGRLVGLPLIKILTASGHDVESYDDRTEDLLLPLKAADVIISATGQARLIKAPMVKIGAVVIDAGTVESSGKLVGDVDPRLYERPDIKVSPVPGGVGPLTVCALFENLLQAAS
ncbi:bifunctional 5,10-methylenetetrahydrofolate dehydrogenase/5,10-methenyltetrahydrofolate cyclohydrolase [Candidatus Microgenomates bacterium]|nr:bifunctional 5,10-methylenetetrahydrofolate dehydrogenase/5,10-methenyltetrahydrofolate cyclohydrolase [Candidatus Microgenomates bacterium]